MQATRIIAIRHGETDWNLGARIQGHLDIGLNETGRHQASRVARALTGESIQAIYSSDLMRAWDTARAIADTTGGTLHAHPGLRERHFGVLQGKTFAEVEVSDPEQSMRWRKRDPDWAPQGGESLVAVRDRIVQTAFELAERHMGEQIVLVAHGGIMDMLYRIATQQALQAPRTWKLGNAAINRLLWTPDGLTLVGWSDERHLEEDQALDETST
jgi:probable phosphoglycerate mutase